MNDASCTYIEPNRRKRRYALEVLFSRAARLSNQYGGVSTCGDPIEGALIWLPPGCHPLTVSQAMRAGLLEATLGIGVTAMFRSLRLMNVVECAHKSLLCPRPYWYLLVAGVDPQRQGSGVNSRLMSVMHAYFDRLRVASVVDATSPELAAYWCRLGYVVRDVRTVPMAGFSYWHMTRNDVVDAEPLTVRFNVSDSSRTRLRPRPVAA